MGAIVFAMHKEEQGKFYVLTKEGIEINTFLPQKNLTMDEAMLLTQEIKKSNPGMRIEFIM